MNKLESKLNEELLARKEANQLRHRLSLTSYQSNEISTDEANYNNFASNDYLGLANHPATINHLKQNIDQLGIGSGASHLVCGHHQIHHELELSLAKFLGRESAITCSTGYMANLAILQTLAKKGDLIIADKLNHASLIDGAYSSQAYSTRYPHCDMDSLESRLKKETANKWVVTDGVFSMDGDIASLDKIAALCDKYQANLIVDDAHGIGVIGDEGRGCGEYFGLKQTQLPVLMGTFGKALGGFGAFVSASKTITEYLVQFARPYIYTTALPAVIASANLFNLELISNNPTFRLKLLENIDYFKSLCIKKNISLLPSDTGIQPVMIRDSQELMAIHQRLKESGILVGAIRPPTVPLNSDRLRITISASHSKIQIKQLVDHL
ncbi:MAG: 8-amino-7-oxononanoate synthase [Kangiellaceae bacterium]|nr:8-amino-7-oxononanoate synthase [Kangiellaceae bacterium]